MESNLIKYRLDFDENKLRFFQSYSHIKLIDLKTIKVHICISDTYIFWQMIKSI